MQEKQKDTTELETLRQKELAEKRSRTMQRGNRYVINTSRVESCLNQDIGNSMLVDLDPLKRGSGKCIMMKVCRV